MSILNIVKDATASFQYYRQGNLYYRTSTGFDFVIPLEDTGDASFLVEDKAIFFMRWIRKQLATDQTATQETENGTRKD